MKQAARVSRGMDMPLSGPPCPHTRTLPQPHSPGDTLPTAVSRMYQPANVPRIRPPGHPPPPTPAPPCHLPRAGMGNNGPLQHARLFPHRGCGLHTLYWGRGCKSQAGTDCNAGRAGHVQVHGARMVRRRPSPLVHWDQEPCAKSILGPQKKDHTTGYHAVACAPCAHGAATPHPT